jgi:glutamyl-tRNA synthetase
MINTPPQIMLYEALGAKVPEFAHLPMMLAPSGEKLSKRHGAVSTTEYRDKGFSPGAVLNYLARFGWSHGDQEVFSKEELIAAFSWEACGRGDGKFDEKKFLSINHEHLKTERLLSAGEYAARTVPFVAQRGVTASTEQIARALPTIRERARTFVEAADMLDYFFRAEPQMDEKASAKFLVKDVAERLTSFRDALAKASEWTEAELEAKANEYLASAGLQIKDVAQAARVALTGRSASPGLYQVLAVLGRETSLARLTKAAEIAASR